MRKLQPEQWRVLGRLIYLCGERARLNDMIKGQEVSPEALCDLVERGLVVAKLNGEELDLTPGLIKTYRRSIHVRLSKAGESWYWDDPHRVLRSVGQARIGLTLSYLLGMVAFEDLAELHRAGLIEAITADEPIDLGNARPRYAGSFRLVLPGGGELWNSAVVVKATKTGRLYAERY
ncbi:hypothetical protein [Actinoplanes sp. M2I2]|uniref:hypothetical protein n=1 Tax=Actinoplanes sp. M2I2 TaxID=1734444 RepID=UPI0020206D5B|nr:hypothetical protein [Actinoplanes sp. M2I2]